MFMLHLSWLVVACLSVSAATILGVSPDLLPRYVPLPSNNWECLDGSKQIPWHFLNDDSCDCPDGSDEPGTSACPDNSFYCVNKGHMGATIFSSRVNDGLCEPECCDGSDEPQGLCPNRCQEIGEEYRQKLHASNKLRKTGSKIRASYITFAGKEQTRLTALVQSLTRDIQVQEVEVARLQDVVDRQQSLSAAELDYKKQSPFYQSLVSHKQALKSLQREHKKLSATEQELADILDTLRSNYNPNYQDMAVLEAVRGWEAVAGLPHIGVEADSVAAAAATTEEEEEQPVEEEHEDEDDKDKGEEEEEWTPEKLDKDLDKLINTDPVQLLLEHDEHLHSTHDDDDDLLSNYLPDALLPIWHGFTDTLVLWLEKLHIVGSDEQRGGGSAVKLESSKSQQSLKSSQTTLTNLRTKLTKTQTDLSKLYEPSGFGSQGEWKKLQGQCVEKDTGDYVYELCWFGDVKQKPKNGGTVFNLGKFQTWNEATTTTIGSPEYYQKQFYKKGTKCWNGPERSVVLVLTCGLENKLYTVEELEKCEYQFTATTPALCLPLTVEDEQFEGKDEL